MTGEQRLEARDRGKALAGKSTLNRLELTPAGGDRSRYKKIVARIRRRGSRASSTLFLRLASRAAGPDRAGSGCDRRSASRPPGGPLLPRLLRQLLLPAAVHLLRRALLCAKLRPVEHRCGSGQRGGGGLDRGTDPRGVAAGADRPPRRQRVLPRSVMAWCEENRVDYVFGLAKNERLSERSSREQLDEVAAAVRADRRAGADVQGLRLSHARELEPRARVSWARRSTWTKGPTRASWSRRCPPSNGRRRRLYETLYCAPRRHGEPHQGTAVACSPTAPVARRCGANQLRLWLSSSLAYVLLQALRQHGSGPDAAGPGPVRHDPPEAAEDRRAVPSRSAACGSRSPPAIPTRALRDGPRPASVSVPVTGPSAAPKTTAAAEGEVFSSRTTRRSALEQRPKHDPFGAKRWTRDLPNNYSIPTGRTNAPATAHRRLPVDPVRNPG